MKKNTLDKEIFEHYKKTKPLPLSISKIEELQNRHQFFAEKHIESQQMMVKYFAELEQLWRELDVKSEVVSTFKSDINTCGVSAIQKCQAERGRLTQMKKENIRELVVNKSKKIAEIEKYLGLKNRQVHVKLIDIPDDDKQQQLLLEKLSEQCEQLESRKIETSHIIDAINERNILIEQHRSLKDFDYSSRRNTSKHLQENINLTKKIEAEIPIRTGKLIYSIEEWQKKHEEQFYFNEQPYLQILKREQSPPTRTPTTNKIRSITSTQTTPIKNGQTPIAKRHPLTPKNNQPTPILFTPVQKDKKQTKSLLTGESYN